MRNRIGLLLITDPGATLVALVRAGVTATCSGADRPRYGNLDVAAFRNSSTRERAQ